tara:strand:+ start:213 stop:4445 length:4233 start_codon:yes stop_codon:yes gene_type:complete
MKKAIFIIYCLLFTTIINSQIIIEQNTVNNVNSSPQNSTNFVGQSFKATIDGVISKISFVPNGTYSADLKVYSGNGNSGTLLHTQSISVTDLFNTTSDFSFFDVTLSSNITITNGAQYTFYLSSNNSTVNIQTAINNTDNAYSDGVFWWGNLEVGLRDFTFKVTQELITPLISTTDASTITKNTVIIGGNIANEGISSVTERGILYSTTDTTPEIGETGVIKDTNGTGTGVFSETITDLQSDTTYYYRAYAINSVGTGYGEIKSFTTLGVSISSIERENPSSEDLNENIVTYKVTFSKPVKDLDVSDFTTNSSGATISSVNQISNTVYEITVNNITTNGDVFLQIKGVNGVAGSNNITTLATIANPNITVNQTESNDYLNQAKLGQTYTAGIDGILKKVTFYPKDGNHSFSGTADLKIYAGDETNGGTDIHSESINITNSTTSSGQEFTLTSTVNVTQGSTYSVVLTNFNGSGNYALSSNTSDAYGNGHVIFTGMNNSSHLNFDLKIKIEEETIAVIGDIALSTIAPLTNEKYIKFPSPILPIIVTTDATSITETQAILGGIVNYSGATAIIERGVVYSTIDSYPKIGETGVTKVLSGQSITTFYAILFGLTTTTNTYFYRAYATNSNGTAYGNVKKFSLNNALHFTGINNIVTISDNASFNFNNGFSFDAMINPVNFSSTRAIASKYSSNGNREFSLLIKPNGAVECTVSNNGSSESYFTTTTSLTLNKWQHIAFTYDTDGTIAFYINGTDAGKTGVTGSPTGAIFNGTADFELGARDGNLDYNGILDEVRVWNKALSATTINQIKNKIVPLNADGLVAYYNFNQGIANGNNSSITSLIDKTSNSLDGTISGFAKTGTTSNFIAGASGNFSNINVAQNSFMTTGNWSDPTKWSFGKVPTQIETAKIEENQVVTIDVDDLEMDELELATNATLNIPADKEIIVNNSFISSGNLSLNSDKTNAGVLLLNGTTTGNITYKRGGLIANEWYIVTPPVAEQAIKTFAENATNDIRVNTTPDPDRYAIATYDDSKAAGSRWVYYDANVNASDEFVPGQSYSMSRATNGDFTFTGTLTVDNLYKTMIAGQWNAIGNPFTTYYPANKNSTSSFLNDNIGVLDANFPSLYLWDDTQSKYVAVTELDASDRSLPPGQGFFVKMKAGETTITFNKDKRTTKPNSGDTSFSKTELNPSIKLQVSKDKTTVSTNLKYFESATIGFDAGLEIGNFNSTGLDIYTRLVDESNSINYTIQSLPKDNYENMIVPIGFQGNKGDEISFNQIATNLPSDIKVFLEDREKNLFIDLTDITANYSLTLSKDFNGINRFYLHTSSNALGTINSNLLEDLKLFYVNNSIKINGLQIGKTSLKIFSLEGKQIVSEKFEATGTDQVQIPNFAKGMYIITISNNNGKISKKIIID